MSEYSRRVVAMECEFIAQCPYSSRTCGDIKGCLRREIVMAILRGENCKTCGHYSPLADECGYPVCDALKICEYHVERK